MGLFDFVKEAGEKIFGKDRPEQTPRGPAAQKPGAGAAAPRAGAPKPGATPTPTFDELRAKALRQAIEKNNLPVTGLVVDVKGDRVSVSGKVATQELREKVVLVLGNVAGVAQVDDRLQVERKEPEAQLYTVKAGDTLSKIAKQYYGNANQYPKIFEANKPMLKDPDKIYPGQVLRIPPAG